MTENDVAIWGRPFRKAIGVLVVLLVLAMFPYSEDPTGDIKNVILSWGSALILAAWLYGITWNHWPIRRPTIFLDILVVFLVLHVASCALSPFRMNSFSEFGKLWYLFVLYLVASQVYTDERQIRRLMLVVCGAMAVASLYGVVIQKFGFDKFPWNDMTSDVYTNLPATFGNPNFAAHALVLAIVMALYLATERRMVWCLGFVAVFFVHLRFTGQRAGWVALLAAALILTVHALVRRRVRRPARGVVATLATVGILGAVGFAAAMGVSKAYTGSAYPLDLSLLIRYKSYSSAAAMVLRHPVLGWGTGNYRIQYPSFWTPYEQRWFAEELRQNAHVHNDLLEFAADAGLPAAGLYLVFLVLGMGYGLYMAATLKEPLKRRLGLTFAALFAVFLVDGLFGFNARVPVSASILFLMAGAMEGFRNANVSREPVAPFQLPRMLREEWKMIVLAVSVLYMGLETFSLASQVFYQDGLGLTKAKIYDRAEAGLKWAERLAPWRSKLARQRGMIAMARRDWSTAAEHLERSMQRNPYYVTTIVMLARCQVSMALNDAHLRQAPDKECLAELDKAEATIQRAQKLCPMFPPIEDLLGRVDSNRAMFLGSMPEKSDEQIAQLWETAEGHLLKAIHYGAQNSSEVYRQLAQVRVTRKNFEGAESAIVRATQADPADNANWPFFYGFACNAKRYDRFSKALSWRISRLSEKQPPDTVNLATAYLWKGSIEQDGFNDIDTAERAFRDAVTTMPSRPDVWSAYARFAETAQRQAPFKEFLIATYDNILANGAKPLPHVAAVARVWREGSNAIVDASVSLLSIVQGKVSVPHYGPIDLDMRWAVLLILQQVRENPPSAEDIGVAMMHLGMVCASIHADDLADQFFPAAMPRLTPDLQRVCAQHWADVLLNLRRPLEAVALLQGMTARFPDDNDVHLAFARTLTRVNRLDEARAQYQLIIDSQTQDEDIRRTAQRELDRLK